MLGSLKSILFIFMVLFIVVNLHRNRMVSMSEISTQREIVVDDEAIDYLIKSLNVAIKANFGGGEAQLRRPNKWIGATKSNLIYLFS